MCIIRYFEFFEIMFLVWYYSSYYLDVFAVLVLQSSERLHKKKKQKSIGVTLVKIKYVNKLNYSTATHKLSPSVFATVVLFCVFLKL